MSLIAYRNRCLIADVTAMIYDDTVCHTTMQKLHVSSTKQFAFAYCGRRIHSRIIPKVHDFIHAALIKAYINDELPNLWLDRDKEKHQAASRTLYIMTADRIFYWNEDNMEELELTDMSARGTNASAFIAATLFHPEDSGYAAKEACEFITGFPATIDMIGMSELEHMTIDEGK